MIRTNVPDAAEALDRTTVTPPPATSEEENNFFESTTAPEYLPCIRADVQKFVEQHSKTRRIAVVTSGGTTVPLENNTVRFIDNFSAGTRGATSAEELLELNYAVIFLHREFSLLPYSRHFSQVTSVLDVLTIDENEKVTVSPEHVSKTLPILEKYIKTKREGTILLVPFTTVVQYIYTLREIALAMRTTDPSKVLFYLAAAVSDFYLPPSRVSEHKIQSGKGKLVIDLDQVPKFLKRLVDTWIPGAMIVSFKLETDPALLLPKCRQALARYGHQLVIGNLLQKRKQEVVFVSQHCATAIRLPQDNAASAYMDIESIFVPKIALIHTTYIESEARKQRGLSEKEVAAHVLAVLSSSGQSMAPTASASVSDYEVGALLDEALARIAEEPSGHLITEQKELSSSDVPTFSAKRADVPDSPVLFKRQDSKLANP